MTEGQLKNWYIRNGGNPMLIFTRHLFYKRNGAEFVVGRHHLAICEKLNQILAGTHPTNKLIINIAPRYGKTELAVKNFIALGLGLNPRAHFIHLSYSANLAQDNSVAIKEILNSDDYRLIFPDTRIKYGSDTKTQWDTEAGGGVYATSTLGQITGFGAGVVDRIGQPYTFGGAIVIDDAIKPEDALSDLMRENVNRRFETTIRNRVNSRNTPIIIIMQRLHEHDLCGYLKGIEPDKWDVLSIPCIERDEDGNERALWEFKHTLPELREIEAANAFVFETQYMQNPKPLEGLMYPMEWRTYDTLPVDRTAVRKNCTDTADTGADFLSSICYVETKTGMYVTEILYTNKPMEYTEAETARMMARNNTRVAYIESNNGGRGFARNVERNLRELGNTRTAVTWFHQTENKQARIFTHSAEVQNLVFFPSGWKTRWPAFYQAVSAFRKDGGNAHDDAPDNLTQMVERFGRGVPMTAEEIDDLENELY